MDFFSPMAVNPMDSFSLSPLLPLIVQLHLGDSQEVRIFKLFPFLSRHWMLWERALHMF